MAVKKKKSTKSTVSKSASKQKKSTAKSAKKNVVKTSKKKPAKALAIKTQKTRKTEKSSANRLKKTVSNSVVAKKVVNEVAPKKNAKTTKKSVVKKQISKTKTVKVQKALPKKNTVTTIAKLGKEKIKSTTEQTNQQTLNSTEKIVKIGVKTKKQLVVSPPLPVITVSDIPKTKVKNILISQPKPEGEKSPYFELGKKYNLNQTFRQFIRIEGISAKDFRSQRIDILEHKAVILTSRLAVDHYFRMCNEMRVTVPETMKYFCINEATAYYLQKYIQYRKRKIFFGHQTIQDLVDVIKKNKEEKFLLPASDVQREQICEFLDVLNINYTKAIMYKTVSADLSDIKNLNEFDMLVFFTPAGIKSLKQNFPNFKQGNTRIACFGPSTAEALKQNGYRLDIYAPNPKNPSMTGAIDEYLKEANKR